MIRNKEYVEKYKDWLEHVNVFGDEDVAFLDDLTYHGMPFIEEKLSLECSQEKLNGIVEAILIQCQVYIDLREGR